MFINKSDSFRLTAYAVSDAKIGIDVEKLRPRKNIFKFADRFFSKLEIDKLSASDNALLDFFKIWTRKEAYLKMLREGIGKRKLSSVCTESIYNLFTTIHKDYVVSICYE